MTRRTRHQRSRRAARQVGGGGSPPTALAAAGAEGELNVVSPTLLLTVVEAANVLRISRNLAYELIARGEIPSVRLGRVIRVPRSGLDAIIRDASVYRRAS